MSSFIKNQINCWFRKSLNQEKTYLRYKNYYKIFRGISARTVLCCFSMGGGNWSYNYLLENCFE